MFHVEQRPYPVSTTDWMSAPKAYQEDPRPVVRSSHLGDGEAPACLCERHHIAVQQGGVGLRSGIADPWHVIFQIVYAIFSGSRDGGVTIRPLAFNLRIRNPLFRARNGPSRLLHDALGLAFEV